MAKLRAGLVGLGMMGRHHARVLGSLDGVDLVAVADPSGDVHGAAAGREVLGAVDELVAKGLDYCVVAAPTGLHEEIGLILAEAGVHTLLEKPLASDVAGAQRLAEAFGSRGLVGAVGHIERYNPSLQRARSMIAEGHLGGILQIVTRRQGPFPGRIADVGVVKDLATHDIDLTSWVAQRPFELVSAQAAYRSGRAHEDLIAITGRLQGGTVTSHLVNWLSPMKERVTIITGERGAFKCDTLSADLTYYANGTTTQTWDDVTNFRGVSEGDVVRYAIAKPEPLRTEHEAFRDAVLGKGADIVTLEQGVRIVEVAEAVLESAASGSAVRLM